MLNNDLNQWYTDGEGQLTGIGDGEYKIQVATPYTLWCPTPAAASVELSLECKLETPNSAMLVAGHAQCWQGEKGLLEQSRRGAYGDYAFGTLEMYTVGFNRTSHVTNETQPNASTANVRRIGGPEGAGYADVDLTVDTPEMKARWAAWNRSTLLCSVAEPASGIDTFYRYAIRFLDGAVELHLGDQMLLHVEDHKPSPLTHGYVAIRNMTPGATFRVRNIAIAEL